MMQLLGGIAVAGVVAAGSTAFTGYGAYSSIATPPHLGGTLTQTVTGAELTAMNVTATAGAVSAVQLTFADTPDAKTVSITSDGTFSTGGIAYYCSNVSSLVSNCIVGTALGAPSGTKSDVSSFSITVS
ncbi:hypothetical protein AB0C07_06740 [Actinoplanes missouriensis]|uniref:hypothetical protein n=1 Tax=Actinoplanes missouriensis TaxID=1866 RepID=UPI0033C253BA